MACFVAPMVEAIVVTCIKKSIEKKEKQAAVSATKDITESGTDKISWSRKLGWLNKLLWGGVSLLAFEHLWHGEIVPWPPFITALRDPADIGPMLAEVAIVGTAMVVLVTAVWGAMVLIADRKVKSKKAASGVKAQA